MTQQELQEKALQWITDHIGKSLDFDNQFGPQCVDEVQFYNRDVIGGSFLYGASAYNIATTYPKDFYDFVENTVDNFPLCGDIVIWGTLVGPNGHIAVCKEGNQESFISLDQNWNYHPYCELVNHSYHGLLGWLRPKTQEPVEQPTPVSEVTPVEIPVEATTSSGKTDVTITATSSTSTSVLKDKTSNDSALPSQNQTLKTLILDLLKKLVAYIKSFKLSK